MPEKKKQHFVPQFLQREFSISPTKKTVRLYLINEHRFIPSSAIKNNFQKEDLYGKHGDAEEKFKEYEDAFVPILKNMIICPDQYMREHKKLDEDGIKFVNSYNLRKPKAIDKAIQDTREAVKRKFPMFLHYFEMLVDSNDFNQLIPYLMPRNYDGTYKILTFEKSIYLPDNGMVGLLPLSPKCLLLWGDRKWIDVWSLLYRSDSEKLVDFINSIFLNNAEDAVIVDKDATLNHIDNIISLGQTDLDYKKNNIGFQYNQLALLAGKLK